MSEMIENYVVDDIEETVTMGRFSKLIGIYVSPVKTFQAIREKKHLLVPSIIVPLFMVLLAILSWPAMERILIAQYEAMNMDAATIDTSITASKYLLPGFEVVGYFFGVLIMAVLFFVVAKIAKSDMSFSGAWTMGIYISVIGIISTVLSIMYTSITGVPDQLKILTSIASFLPDNMSGQMIYYIIKPIDIIVVWQVILVYLGFFHYGKLSKKASVIGAVAYFAFVLVLSIIMGLITMASTGTL